MKPAWEALHGHLRARTGFALGEDRYREIELAVRGIQSDVGGTLHDLVASLAEGEGPIERVVDEVMVGETHFFREPAHFALLREVLPTIAGPIRIWSAGCASGEEAYSIAITARELGLAERCEIQATDLSRASLSTARAGLFPTWSLRGPDTHRAAPWLTPVENGLRPLFQLDRRILDGVTFRYGNLIGDVFPSEQHVIFCRNVLIYLRRPVIAEIARRLYDSLADGGWLVLASSDPRLAEYAPFRLVESRHGHFLQKLAATVAPKVTPPAPIQAAAPVPRVRPARPLPAPVAVAVPVLVEPEGRPSLAAQARLLADRGELRTAMKSVEEALRTAPHEVELHLLHGVLLRELRRPAEALESYRRALYLDPDSVAAHLGLAATRRETGDREGARRAYKLAHRLCAALPPDTIVPLADGASAAWLAAVAAREAARP